MLIYASCKICEHECKKCFCFDFDNWFDFLEQFQVHVRNSYKTNKHCFGKIVRNMVLSHINLAVLNNSRHGGGGSQKSGKNADIIYGWSLQGLGIPVKSLTVHSIL